MATSTTLDQSYQLFRAFADPTRLRILNLLSEGELCVCHLIDILRLPQSTISRHLAYLKRAGLVTSREEGTWNHYSLAEPCCELQAQLMACVRTCLHELAPFAKDRQRVKQCCGN